MGYRDPGEIYAEVREWDIILMHGSVRVMGMTYEHLKGCAWQEFGAKCDCHDQPRISSPVLCPDTRRELVESWWSHEPTTGEGRHLLESDEGSLVPVLSGKVYRLVGPRKVEGYNSFACGSIFLVYAREDEKESEPEPESWWTRVRRVLRLAS